jgi:hypothetical protein
MCGCQAPVGRVGKSEVNHDIFELVKPFTNEPPTKETLWSVETFRFNNGRGIILASDHVDNQGQKVTNHAQMLKDTICQQSGIGSADCDYFTKYTEKNQQTGKVETYYERFDLKNDGTKIYNHRLNQQEFDSFVKMHENAEKNIRQPIDLSKEVFGGKAGFGYNR